MVRGGEGVDFVERAEALVRFWGYVEFPGLKAGAIVIAFSCMVHSAIQAQTHQTIGPGGCGVGQNNCHATENNWWKNDPHKVTVDAFYADPESYQKIADLSGVGAANMYKGTSNCMKCHGTVVTGKESKDVEEGVSCESCHGPGSGYKDPHQEGVKGTGAGRAGYVKGLQLGMADLKNTDRRAQACVKCHYVTDEKLLAAGHPSGAKFNYITGIRTKVAKHWRRAATDADGDKSTFEKAKAARGPVPKTVAAATPSAQTGGTPSGMGEVPVRRQLPPPRQPRADVSLPAPASLGPIELPAFPEITDSTSVDQVLLLLKKRIELLYKKTGN
ncbi:MAG: multiheme c-type cytochrome [Bacteroidota bacterium]